MARVRRLGRRGDTDMVGAEVLWGAMTVPRDKTVGSEGRVLLFVVGAAGLAMALAGLWLVARAT